MQRQIVESQVSESRPFDFAQGRLWGTRQTTEKCRPFGSAEERFAQGDGIVLVTDLWLIISP
jgi:hypothetical protein